ncbi:unnamed protein product [Dovyalis caffra]|uniref:Alpha-1,3-glucosyltransferase n=1 Tax=Dovyalis caffra TaxID=77055 RepID=A0AAV1S2I1_9ROSI|nr:unnamed protein product [Dovyalis caffra]
MEKKERKKVQILKLETESNNLDDISCLFFQKGIMGSFLLISIFSLLLRVAVSLHSYSGAGSPPKFGDFEAQRHWMEITTNLPIKDWYFNTTNNDLSYWGLDYPPLTAYQSYFHGLFLKYFDPNSVSLFTSRGYETCFGKLLMRWTVLSSDLLIFFPAVLYFVLVYYGGTRSGLNKSDVAWHIAYNCISLGLTLGAVAAVLSQKDLLACVLFCLSLNHKQEIGSRSSFEGVLKTSDVCSVIPYVLLTENLRAGNLLSQIRLDEDCDNVFSRKFAEGARLRVLSESEIDLRSSFEEVVNMMHYQCLTTLIKGWKNNDLAMVTTLAQQMSAYYAPAFFSHLFGSCLRRKNPLLEVFKLGLAVVGTFAIVWWPYLHSRDAIFGVLSRLAPFERGIYEDYVANFWCSTSVLIKWKRLFTTHSLRFLSLVATILAFLPSMIQQVLAPSSKGFLYGLLNSSFAFYLFSFQVHSAAASARNLVDYGIAWCVLYVSNAFCIVLYVSSSVS